jgi:ferritin-like metal-binding protein YciE
LREHREETRQHVTNIEQCFKLLDEDVDDSPCPVVEAMAKDGAATIKKTDDSLVDAVILAAATESEHYEIAVYETLITNAGAGARPRSLRSYAKTWSRRSTLWKSLARQ